MQIPAIPDGVFWRDGLVLEPSHFQRTDQRNATLSHISGLIADPWPWGFTNVELDETALASSQLRVTCEGIFPNGDPFRQRNLTMSLDRANEGEQANFHIIRQELGGEITIQKGEDAPAEKILPVARLIYHGGVWSALPDWSPPMLLIGPDHPMRVDINRQLGALAALGAGFMTTLRLPGAEERPVARVLGQVAAALVQGVGVIEALLAAPAVAPGRVGLEALRLALGVRVASGVFERMDNAWDPADQRGSMQRLLYAAESAASGIGLPFRTSLFRSTDDQDVFVVDGMPSDVLLLAIEASRPADLIAARSWLEGAALASPDRIQEALTRRVSGCNRSRVERDPRLGISSGPLLALYHVDADMSWRGGSTDLALASKTPPPPNTSFSVFLPEGPGNMGGGGGALGGGGGAFGGGGGAFGGGGGGAFGGGGGPPGGAGAPPGGAGAPPGGGAGAPPAGGDSSVFPGGGAGAPPSPTSPFGPAGGGAT